MTLEEIRIVNKNDSESSAVSSWAAWFEGEESWGADIGDD